MSLTFDPDHVKNLKNSLEQLGLHLQPVIVEKGTEGRKVLVGRHRKIADPHWPEIEVEVKDDLHRELIITHGLVQRSSTKEETSQRLLRIARILEQRGILSETVCSKMSKIVPYNKDYIARLLPDKYKMISRRKKNKGKGYDDLSRHTKMDVESVKRTVMEPLQANPGDPSSYLPFPDCKCMTCMHRKECHLI